jgi:hypothetical protein
MPSSGMARISTQEKALDVPRAAYSQPCSSNASGLHGRNSARIGKSARAFKGIICDDVSEFESDMPSHAVGLRAGTNALTRTQRPSGLHAGPPRCSGGAGGQGSDYSNGRVWFMVFSFGRVLATIPTATDASRPSHNKTACLNPPLRSADLNTTHRGGSPTQGLE